MVKLSKRLKTIADMIPKSVVADVGSDHGKLMIYLFENGIIEHGYAIENKKGPFERLKTSLISSGIEDYVVPLLSDGISELPNTVNTIVIAGMGGKNIIDIVLSHKAKLKNVSTIIVDAHSNVSEVREVISKIGYNIADEKILKEDGIYYEIIKFIKSDVAFYNENDLEFGPILRNEKPLAFKEKYEERIFEIDTLMENAKLPDSKKQILLKEKERIIGILQWKQRYY